VHPDPLTKKIANLDLLISRLGLGLLSRLHIHNGLDLGCCVGRRRCQSLGGDRLRGGLLITKTSDGAVLVFVHCGDAHVADRHLELDQRMGVVVHVRRKRFAVGAKVGIMADGTFVSDTLDMGCSLLVFA
jgi:hypothetical protein